MSITLSFCRERSMLHVIMKVEVLRNLLYKNSHFGRRFCLAAETCYFPRSTESGSPGVALSQLHIFLNFYGMSLKFPGKILLAGFSDFWRVASDSNSPFILDTNLPSRAFFCLILFKYRHNFFSLPLSARLIISSGTFPLSCFSIPCGEYQHLITEAVQVQD